METPKQKGWVGGYTNIGDENPHKYCSTTTTEDRKDWNKLQLRSGFVHSNLLIERVLRGMTFIHFLGIWARSFVKGEGRGGGVDKVIGSPLFPLCVPVLDMTVCGLKLGGIFHWTKQEKWNLGAVKVNKILCGELFI